MHDSEKFGVYQGQVQTYAAFSGVMAGVVMFFTGILLTRYTSFDVSIRVPIAFLLVSIFGFLFGTLLYTNAAEEVSNFDEPRFRRVILLGDIVSEYLGVYLLVVGIPLIINIITNDVFLRVVTILASLTGLAAYQFSRFSIIERHFGRGHRAVSGCILALGLLLFVTQLFPGPAFMVLAVVFMVLMVAVTILALRRHS